MLNSRALAAGIAAVRDADGLITEETARQFVGVYLTASMPEDVKGLISEWDAIFKTGGAFGYGHHISRTIEALASLSAKVEELTRENIVAPAECGANCDDPHCHYSHHPLTLRQAYENSLERLRCVEASLAERDRIIAEKDKALDELLELRCVWTDPHNDELRHRARAARDRRAS